MALDDLTALIAPLDRVEKICVLEDVLAAARGTSSLTGCQDLKEQIGLITSRIGVSGAEVISAFLKVHPRPAPEFREASERLRSLMLPLFRSKD